MATSDNITFGSELLRRRVIQTLGIYLGATLAIMEFTDMMIERYALANELWDLVLVAMLSLMPTVLILSWRHGAPGPDQWGRTERIGIPVNVASMILLLTFLFGGAEVGSVAQQVQAVDAQGVTVTRNAPKAKLIKHVGLFFSDVGVALSEEERWLVYGLTLVTATHLDQDPFMEVDTLYDGFAEGQFWRIKRAGFKDALKVPVSLLSEVAGVWQTDCFVRGTLTRADGELALTVQLVVTESMATKARGELRGETVYDLAEALSGWLKEKMEIPRAGEGMVKNLPATDLWSSNPEVLREVVDGFNAYLLDNDATQAVIRWQSALQSDPRMARTGILLAETLADLGRTEEAQDALKEAMHFDYSLTNAERYGAKSMEYMMDGNEEGARNVIRTWVDLYPEDTQALNTLAKLDMWANNAADRAVDALERSLQIDPSQDWILEKLGHLYQVLGQMDRAVASLEAYAKKRPDEYNPLVELGKISLKGGDFVGARAQFERAAVVETDMVTPVLSLAVLALRTGDIDVARDHIRQAWDIAAAPRQDAAVLGIEMTLLKLIGRPTEALQKVDLRAEAIAAYKNELDTFMGAYFGAMEVYYEADAFDLLVDRVQRLEAKLQPPMNQFGSIVYFYDAFFRGDVESARIHVAELESFITTIGRSALQFHALQARGYLSYLEGNFAGAVALFRDALRELDESAYGDKGDFFRTDMTLAMAQALRRSGEPETAKEQLSALLVAWPMHPAYLLELARVERDLGHLEIARGHLERVLEFWAQAEPRFLEIQDIAEVVSSLE